MLLSNCWGSVSWTTHSGCQALRGGSEAFRRIKKHASENRICDLLFPNIKPLRLQCSSLAQMKTHSITFLGVWMWWPAHMSFKSRRGASPTHNKSLWMKESTLECSPLNLCLHTWCKVIGSTWVRTQHCSFSRDKMVHSRHLSTIVQELINVHTSLSPPRPRTSPPSPHWLQQYANHVSTGSYLVTIIAPTQCREQAPDQIC